MRRTALAHGSAMRGTELAYGPAMRGTELANGRADIRLSRAAMRQQRASSGPIALLYHLCYPHTQYWCRVWCYAGRGSDEEMRVVPGEATAVLGRAMPARVCTQRRDGTSTTLHAPYAMSGTELPHARYGQVLGPMVHDNPTVIEAVGPRAIRMVFAVILVSAHCPPTSPAKLAAQETRRAGWLLLLTEPIKCKGKGMKENQVLYLPMPFLCLSYHIPATDIPLVPICRSATTFLELTYDVYPPTPLLQHPRYSHTTHILLHLSYHIPGTNIPLIPTYPSATTFLVPTYGAALTYVCLRDLWYSHTTSIRLH
eukprot:1848767-Rhodomonas_salina.1